VIEGQINMEESLLCENGDETWMVMSDDTDYSSDFDRLNESETEIGGMGLTDSEDDSLSDSGYGIR
jgi:hypothetical protein